MAKVMVPLLCQPSSDAPGVDASMLGDDSLRFCWLMPEKENQTSI